MILSSYNLKNILLPGKVVRHPSVDLLYRVHQLYDYALEQKSCEVRLMLAVRSLDCPLGLKSMWLKFTVLIYLLVIKLL